MPQSPATRPEDLRVTPLYGDESAIDCATPGPSDQSSYPSSSFMRNGRQMMEARIDLNSTRGSSAESETSAAKASVPRKAYMDLSDAMALLDETCPNPDASPSLTPRTPRTPLTPHPRNKRARSKSSDNSSNYSSDRLSEKTTDSGKERERRRPFLKKIGISKTEDRPFLAKIAPRIVGKPYLEKIGPSKAVEKPFLDKIGSSKTLDKFSFDAIRDLPRAMMKRTHTTTIEPAPIRRTRVEESKDSVLVVEEETEQPEVNHIGVERKRSGKGFLLKMYSFETEDLDEDALNPVKERRDELRGVSLDDVLDSGPSSLPPLEDVEELSSPQLETTFAGTAELVKCRVTTSEEIVSSSTGHLNSPARGAVSWSNSPRWPIKQQTTDVRTLEREFGSRAVLESDEESIPNSPARWRAFKVSPESQMTARGMSRKTKNSSLRRDLDASPTKTRRQTLEEPLESEKSPEFDLEGINKSTDEVNRAGSEELLTSTNRRQIFEEAIEKFGGSDYMTARTRRQVSEDILDKSDDQKNGDFERYNDHRRGISSDNLRYSRETIVGSAPSASSLGYQSGDSSFISQRSSNNSQDMLRGAFKHLHEKFELQDVPPESYAAFKIRSRANYERQKFIAKETTIGPTIQVGKVYDINYKDSGSQEIVGNSTSEKDTEEKENKKENVSRSGTVKSVLRKQERVDHGNDQEVDLAGSVRRPMRRIFHEPSQETMDLLTELKKVKSLLRTPSEEGKDWELDCLKPARMPKKISLTDKEFCLSVERENSIRRPSVLKVQGGNGKVESHDQKEVLRREEIGPALFEKRCMSLDYADDVRPPKPEARAISLASARRFGTEETLDSSDPCNLYDSKSCLSDVFTTPTDDGEDKTVEIKHVPKATNNHFQDVDIAIPIDQTSSISPKKRVQIQGRTSDLYEIISPRSTPFRVKKRLGRISVEETVKPESFTLDKVDCRSVATQKRTKCFPL
ncbi:uncharacterized protein LOC107036331 [Diachasma alloeum]|uniref:uncharacterized protein LOC107036331 n=1 Tax=Diachasma alloeum TaxID=454923 RepID=UPI0007383B06|nr:uncharacterized protein LOC107036331 [Diachasma alloeum]